MTSSGPTPSSPGVHVPPPFLYAVPGGLGYLLHRRIPWPLVPTALDALREPAGLVLVTAALCGIAWAILRFRLAGTTVLPHRPANAFVVVGPYRITRNPMYVGMAVLLIGLALLANSLWMACGVPVGMLLVNTFVIPREEAYLTARFGDSYVDYTRRVRRWL